jgi:hypothetical protein
MERRHCITQVLISMNICHYFVPVALECEINNGFNVLTNVVPVYTREEKSIVIT